MESTEEYVGYKAPPISVGDTVMFQADHNTEKTTAFVTHVGFDGACEVQYFQRTGEATGTWVGRDNVKHIDDPEARSELYIQHVIGDEEGGLWSYTSSTAALYNALEEIAELKKLVRTLTGNVADSAVEQPIKRRGRPPRHQLSPELAAALDGVDAG